MFRRTFILAFLAALSSGQALLAQTAPIKAEVRLLAFNPAMQPTEVFLHDPTGPPDAPAVKTEILTYLNHQFVSVPLTSRKLVITSKPERVSITSDTDVVGEVTLPPGGESSILLFLPGKSPGSRAMFKVMPVPDSKKAFPGGSIFVTNLSPLAVRLKLEQKVIDFKPGQPQMIENPPVREGGMIGMRAAVFKDNSWLEVSTSLWPHPGESRVLMILFQDPKTGHVQLKGFDDVTPHNPTPPTAATP